MAARASWEGSFPTRTRASRSGTTRAKARLMKGTLTSTQLQVALELLIEQHPESALDAMISASGEQ